MSWESSLTLATVSPENLRNSSPAVVFQAYSTVSWVNGAVYSALFVFVYIQMWMILYYKHRRLSYQTVFLFTCLVWAALRVIVFSINYSTDTTPTYLLPSCLYWMLYCLPVCLQYVILVLLLVFFSQVLLKAQSRVVAIKHKSCTMIAGLVVVLMFATVNMICTAMARPPLDYGTARQLVLVRVCVNDSLFVITGALLSYCIFLLGRRAAANSILRAKGTTLRQSYVVCAFIILLYVSKAAYNVVTVVMSHRMGNPWLRVSDQAELVSLHEDYNLAVFGAALLIWEALPTIIVVLFFRVQKPISRSDSLTESEAGRARQVYFSTADDEHVPPPPVPPPASWRPRAPGEGSMGNGGSCCASAAHSDRCLLASTDRRCYDAIRPAAVHRVPMSSHSSSGCIQ